MLGGVEPPSTPSPVALRGARLDDALRDVDPLRTTPDSGVLRTQPHVDPRDAMDLAERIAREARLDAPVSDAPMTLRGEALASALRRASRALH